MSLPPVHFQQMSLPVALQGCHDLKEGSYSICVQFFNVDRVAISNEVCKEFTVETPREPDYAPPTLINPESGKTVYRSRVEQARNFPLDTPCA
jgi:hypothetical protein